MCLCVCMHMCVLTCIQIYHDSFRKQNISFVVTCITFRYLTLWNNDSYIIGDVHIVQVFGLDHVGIESDDLILFNAQH